MGAVKDVACEVRAGLFCRSCMGLKPAAAAAKAICNLNLSTP